MGHSVRVTQEGGGPAGGGEGGPAEILIKYDL